MAEGAVASFSVSDAALEGVRVIRERWRVLMGWAAFNLIALVGALVVIVVLAMATIPFAGSRDQAGEIGGGIGAFVLVGTTVLIQIVLTCGLYRIMLRPEEPGFLHLRIGRDELRVLGTVLLIGLAALPLILAVVAVLFGLRAISPLAAIFGFVPLVLGLYLVLIRLGLAPVIAFAEHRIDLVDAWRRTRGQTWRLFGMVVLLFCVLAVLGIAAWLLLFVVGGLLTGFGDVGLSDAETLEAHPVRFLFQFLAEMLLTPFFLALTTAPWVAVYRALPKAA